MKKLFVFALFIAMTMIVTAQTDKRLALVIGNSAYQNGGKLANPVNDAVLMTKTLESLGFTVIKHYNADLKTMQLATADFTRQIKNYKVALFYYAGHGVQVDGENFLIPIDAKLDDKVMTKFEALNISFVNDAFVQNKENINIMVLDACRNDPFRAWARGGERGFKAVDNNSKGVIIAFATQPNSVAADGETNTSKNGVYTEQLVKQMLINNDIEKVFKYTRAEVNRITAGKQVPQEWSSLIGDFYFVKPNANSTISQTSQTNTQPDEGGLETGNVVYEYGTIIINTEIAGTLYVDGKAKGNLAANSQNNKLNKQLAGTHTIEIRGAETYSETVTVEKDQASTVNVKSTKKKDVVIKSGSFTLNADYTANISGVSGGMAVSMRGIRGGGFTMGTNDGESDEKPAHTVTVGNFAMMKYEVTFDEYDKYCDATNITKPSDQGWGRGKRPVINVSWDDATAYAKWLSQKTGQTWRLPTEAEWEYAAKGGIENKYAGSDNVEDVAWLSSNSGSKTKEVGQKQPNGYGLYDMSGNVWEWCSDWYKGYPGSSGVSDYTGSNRVLRGGSWYDVAANCRVANRDNNSPDNRNNNYGFRLVLVP